jgi:hypothetical protein
VQFLVQLLKQQQMRMSAMSVLAQQEQLPRVWN